MAAPEINSQEVSYQYTLIFSGIKEKSYIVYTTKQPSLAKIKQPNIISLSEATIYKIFRQMDLQYLYLYIQPIQDTIPINVPHTNTFNLYRIPIPIKVPHTYTFNLYRIPLPVNLPHTFTGCLYKTPIMVSYTYTFNFELGRLAVTSISEQPSIRPV